MIRRIIDKRGKYYSPVSPDPTGTNFCRVMNQIAVKCSDVLKEARCDLVIRQTPYNGYLGKVTSFIYNEVEDRYDFIANVTNEDNIGASFTYYMFIGMRLFELNRDEIAFGACTIYTSDADELYNLMRRTEDKGLIDSSGVISGVLWSVRDDSAPIIEYEATWPGNTKVVDIPSNEFTNLPKGRNDDNYKLVTRTTGIEIRSKDNNVVIDHFTGIACVSADSKYGPNFIEYKACDDESVEVFRIRVYMNIFSIQLESLCTYDTNENHTWGSPRISTSPIDYNDEYPSRYPYNGYYDAEDFSDGEESEYLTPSELYIFRVKLRLEIPLLFADTNEYEITDHHYRSFINSGQDTAYVSGTSLTAAAVIDYAGYFTLDDLVGSELADTIDNVSIGDYMKMTVGSVEHYGVIKDIDYASDQLTVISETLIAGTITAWSLYEKYDMIKKIASYARAYNDLEGIHDMEYMVDHELEYGDKSRAGRNNYNIASYYGRPGKEAKSTINFLPLTYSEKMYIPGIVGEEVLSEYSEYEEVYVSPGDILLVSGEPFLVLRESTTHHGMVEVLEKGTKINFRFNNCVPYEDAEDVTNDTSNMFFFINSAVSDVYIESISILSKYIENIYLQNKESYERYLWVRNDDESIMYDIDIVQDNTTLTVDMIPSTVIITIGDTTSFPSSGTVLINGEVMTYSAKTGTTLTGVTRGTNPRRHNIGDTVYCIKNLLIRKVLLGTIDNSIDDDDETMSITEDSGFVLPITMPYTNDLSGDTRYGIITIDDEMFIVDWSEYTAGTIPFTGLTRGAHGSVAGSHPQYSDVYVYDYLNSGEIIRGNEYNNEYNGKYIPVISIDHKVETTDVISTLKVYVVRVKWNM